MDIQLTRLEDFLQDGMTRSEIVPDLNGLYALINRHCEVDSSEYRCYITPRREMLVLFSSTGEPKCSSDELIQLIYDETVLKSYGIQEIKFVSADDFEENHYSLGESSYSEEIQDYAGERIDLEDYSFQGSFALVSLALPESLPPDYRDIVEAIVQIKGMSLSTLREIIESSQSAGIPPENESFPVSLNDRYIILNTLEVFLADIANTADYGGFKEELQEMKEYFYDDAGLEEGDATRERKEKEKLITLNYLIGEDTTPFSRRDITIAGRKISIKLYLLLAFSYFQYARMRKMERSFRFLNTII